MVPESARDEGEKETVTLECTNPACHVAESSKVKLSCDFTEKCVAACAAYGKVCPCAARAAGKAAHEALTKLLEDSKVFDGKPPFRLLNNEDVAIKEKLGEGGFSYVNSCVLQNGDSAEKALAVKYLKRQVMVEVESFQHGASDLAIEAYFLQMLDHPNIVSLEGITSGSVETNVATGKECGFFIVVERLYDTLEKRIEIWKQAQEKSGGNIVKRMSSEYKEQRRLALMERVKIALEISKAMEYLHKNGIIYRDLKPDNIGFDKDGRVKIFDFGLAKELKPSIAVSNGRYELTGNTGSRRYMAPEVAKGLPYDLSVDVYSFGILLWEICAADKPFFGYSSGKHMKQVVLGGERPSMNSSYSGHWPMNLQWLMKRCWSPFAVSRPSFEVVRQTLTEILECKESIPPTIVTENEGSGEEKKPKQRMGFLKMPAMGAGRSSSVTVVSARAAPEDTTVSTTEKLKPPAGGFGSMKRPTKEKGRSRTWGFGRQSVG